MLVVRRKVDKGVKRTGEQQRPNSENQYGAANNNRRDDYERPLARFSRAITRAYVVASLAYSASSLAVADLLRAYQVAMFNLAGSTGTQHPPPLWPRCAGPAPMI
jgi:hypothetical protein